MGCTNTTAYTGRRATLEIAFQCPDVDPAAATYLPIGGTTTKSFNMSASTEDATSDLSGGFDDNIITSAAMELSCDVNSTSADGTLVNQTQLFKYYFDSLNANPIEQPTVLVRYTWPDVTLVAYMNVSDFSRSNPDRGVSTATISFTKAPSPDYPPTLTDTVVV